MADVIQILKKQWVSVTCGIIAILAILALPLYMSGQVDKVQQTLNDRKKTYDELVGLKTKSRHLPILNPAQGEGTTAPDLTQFPDQKVIDAGKAATDQVDSQSLAIEKEVIRLNSQGHTLLVPGSLPAPPDPYRFQRAYVQRIQSELPGALNSAAPPTEQEIAAEEDRQVKEIERRALRDEHTGQFLFREAVDQQIATMKAGLPEKMKQDASKKHKIYMGSDALSANPAMVGGQSSGGAGNPNVGGAADPEQIWYAQMGLWVQEDVIAAIIDLNQKSTQVATSPVKQIVRIEVAPDKSMYAVPSAASAGAAAAAAPAPASPTGAPPSPVPANTDTDPLPKDYTVSPTGRVCNGMFDVVHFTLVLQVQAADVNRVIAALEQNRLLTVYQTDVSAVNSVEAAQNGYLFGKSPVATITLSCEEVFMRDWTRKWMPKPVKEYLNVQDQPAAGQPGQPTASTNG